MPKWDSLRSWSFYLLSQVSSNNSRVTGMSCNQLRLWAWFLLCILINSQSIFLYFICLCTIDSTIHSCLYNICSDLPMSQLLHLLSKGAESKRFPLTWVGGDTFHAGTNSRTKIYFLWYQHLPLDIVSRIKMYLLCLIQRRYKNNRMKG